MDRVIWCTLLDLVLACGGESTDPGPVATSEPDTVVASIQVTPDTATLTVGEMRQLTATLRNAAGRTLTGPTVSWTTSDDAVAIVTAGLVGAMGVGQATITASAHSQTDQAGITVRGLCQVSDLSVSPPGFTVAMGTTVTLTAMVTQQNCTDLVISWSSADTTIATVSDDGVVTGVWPGAATITATVEGTSVIAISEATVRPPYPEGRITFSRLPMDPAQSVGFIGLGNLNVLPEDHGAFLASMDGVGQPSTIPVYAPADGWIVGLIYDSTASRGRDLSMRIRYSTTIRTNFGHLSDFAPEIWEASGLLERGFGDYRIYIPVSGGQIVAYTGEQPGFDFYVGDDALELGFLNPSRYPYPWLKAGYYYDYFEEPLLSELRALTIRQDEPRAGKIDYDIPGRIIGNWFLEGTVGWGGEQAQLAIVYDFIDGTRVAIADGSTRSDTVRGAEVYWVEGNAPRPETVGVGDGITKYEIRWRWFRDRYRSHDSTEVLGTFLVEMFEVGKIRVEKVLGKRAHEVTGFSGAARVYER